MNGILPHIRFLSHILSKLLNYPQFYWGGGAGDELQSPIERVTTLKISSH